MKRHRDLVGRVLLWFPFHLTHEPHPNRLSTGRGTRQRRARPAKLIFQIANVRRVRVGQGGQVRKQTKREEYSAALHLDEIIRELPEQNTAVDGRHLE